jgi:membrane associated rhomboid family serine protease
MDAFRETGRLLIALGVVLAVVGALLAFNGRLPFRLGRLPGDIVYQGRNGSFYFPVVTCILLSLVLSLLLWAVNHFRR